MSIKNIEITGIITIIIIVISALAIINLIDKKKKLGAETKRKAFHMSMGISMLLFPYLFENVISVLVLAVIAIIGMLILKYTFLKEKLGNALYSVERKSLRRVLLYNISISNILAFWAKQSFI